MDRREWGSFPGSARAPASRAAGFPLSPAICRGKSLSADSLFGVGEIESVIVEEGGFGIPSILFEILEQSPAGMSVDAVRDVGALAMRSGRHDAVENVLFGLDGCANRHEFPGRLGHFAGEVLLADEPSIGHLGVEASEK